MLHSPRLPTVLPTYSLPSACLHPYYHHTTFTFLTLAFGWLVVYLTLLPDGLPFPLPALIYLNLYYIYLALLLPTYLYTPTPVYYYYLPTTCHCLPHFPLPHHLPLPLSPFGLRTACRFRSCRSTPHTLRLLRCYLCLRCGTIYHHHLRC